MVSGAMAVQLLSSSMCSSYFGSVADSLEASNSNVGGGKNKGRMLVMSRGLLLSTIAVLMHGLGSVLFVHRNDPSDETQQYYDSHNSSFDVAGGSIDSSELEYDLQQPNDAAKISRPLLAYHLFLRALFAIGTSSTSPVLDGLTLSQLDREGRDKDEYGKERVYGAVSWAIGHMILGPVIDSFGFKTMYASTVLAFVGCMATFYFYDRSTSTIECVEVCEIEDGGDWGEEKKSSDEAVEQGAQESRQYQNETSLEGSDTIVVNEANDTTKNETAQDRLTFVQLVRLISQTSPVLNISYVISLFALYIGMSVVESLVFLYFEFLGGSNTMCGMTVTVTVLFELPLFHFAPEVLKMLGSPTSMLQWGCLAYVVRVIGYSIVPQSRPYWVLLLEPLHGITIAFALTSSVAMADGWMPRGYEASGQGLLSTIRSLGQFVGFCIAGGLEGRTLYRALAAVVTVGTFVLGMGKYVSSDKPRARYTPLQ